MNNSILCAFLVLEIGTTLKQKNGVMYKFLDRQRMEIPYWLYQSPLKNHAKYISTGNLGSKIIFEKIKLQGFKTFDTLVI